VALILHRAASSNSGPLFFTFPTAFDTGRLASTSSFAGFISAAAASGSPFNHRSLFGSMLQAFFGRR
jgi:hypothetical protein